MAITTKLPKLIDRYQRIERLSSSDMARGIGVTRQSVSQWRHGQARPSIALLLHLIMESDGWPRQFALDVIRHEFPRLAALLENRRNGDILSQNSNRKGIDKP